MRVLYRFKQRVVKRAKPIASAKRRAAAGSILHMAEPEAMGARSVSVLSYKLDATALDLAEPPRCCRVHYSSAK